MFDYSTVILARIEHEALGRQLGHEPSARLPLDGPVRHALFGLEAHVIEVKRRLTAPREPMQRPQTLHTVR